MNLDKYISTISSLNSDTDSKFKYNPNIWSKLNSEFKDLASEFEYKDISRADVINAYRNYYTNGADFKKAFVLTMIWGFSDAGYGTFRTNVYISKPENLASIEKAIKAVKDHDLKYAFNSLKKIRGLGISYLTKVLYFATRAARHENYALIYDIRVAKSLVKLSAPKEISDIVTVNPSSKFDDYVKYNALIHSLAKKHSVEAEAIEMFLFMQEF